MSFLPPSLRLESDVVPFLDLKAQLAPIRSEILSEMEAVLDQTAFSGGPFVERFEREFARYCETPEALGVGNGTDALGVVLRALQVGPGDEVITVPNTFIATAEAISYTGARPVFVDVEEESCNLDPRLLEGAITERTRAILPVHLYGQMADMDPILEIAARHGIPVIEDACQAHGALYRGRRAGSLGLAGCFSFYPGKNLGAYGEGGAVVTADAALAEAMRMLREHGQKEKYHHEVVGWNARMDGLQGAVLSVKLRYLEEWTEARRRVAGWYREALGEVEGIRLPQELEGRRHVYHLYAIQSEAREALRQSLAEEGVQTGIHYPIPLHLQPAYRPLGYREGEFPVSERLARQTLSLPMYAELAQGQVERVAGAVRRFQEEGSHLLASLPA